jgi:chromosome segregation ATPase
LPAPDFAQTLQARILADQEEGATANRREAPLKQSEGRAVQARIAALEEALVKAETQREHWRQEADTAAKRIEELEIHVAELAKALAEAEALAKQRHGEAHAAAKRADHLVAELVQLTSELVEMSKRMAAQVAMKDRLRTELEEFRARS